MIAVDAVHTKEIQRFVTYADPYEAVGGFWSLAYPGGDGDGSSGCLSRAGFLGDLYAGVVLAGRAVHVERPQGGETATGANFPRG